MTNKQRKETLVDEVLADRDIKNYSKRKYEEIQAEKSRAKRGKKNHGAAKSTAKYGRKKVLRAYF